MQANSFQADPQAPYLTRDFFDLKRIPLAQSMHRCSHPSASARGSAVWYFFSPPHIQHGPGLSGCSTHMYSRAFGSTSDMGSGRGASGFPSSSSGMGGGCDRTTGTGCCLNCANPDPNGFGRRSGSKQRSHITNRSLVHLLGTVELGHQGFVDTHIDRHDRLAIVSGQVLAE